MRTLNRSRRVACPPLPGRRYLRDYIRELVGADGDAAHLVLRVPIASTHQGRGIEIEEEQPVTASFINVTRPGRDEPTYEVSWTPEDGAIPFPRFEGLLHLIESGSNALTLELHGNYRPPLGVVGEALDAAVGHRVMESIADDFLGRIADRLESDYRKGVPTA